MLAAVDAIAGDYTRQDEPRRIAEDYFDAASVATPARARRSGRMTGVIRLPATRQRSRHTAAANARRTSHRLAGCCRGRTVQASWTSRPGRLCASSFAIEELDVRSTTCRSIWCKKRDAAMLPEARRIADLSPEPRCAKSRPTVDWIPSPSMRPFL